MIRLRAESPSTSYSPPPNILSHTRASMAMMRVDAPSTYILASQLETPPSGTPPLLPIPLPTSSPPLLLPSTNRRVDRPKVCLPPWNRLCIAQGPRYEVGESSSAPRPTGGFRADYGFVATLDAEIRCDLERDVGYGITNTWDEMLVGMPGAPATDDTELGRRLTDFVTTVRQDTDEIYGRLDDAQDDRSLMSGRLNMLFRDRRAHAHIALLIEREARLSREVWGWLMDASDTARSEVRVLRTTVLAQQTGIAALRAANRARQAQLMKTLRLMSTLQTQVTALQGQQGPTTGPTHPDNTDEAAIIFNDNLTSNEALSCEPTVSSLNKIDFRISFDESDDEDYTIVYDENSISYKIISVNNLKTDSKNDNEKLNMPSFPSPEPEVSYFNDLDFFKDFENEFPAIVYNDSLTSKSDLLTEPTISPRHIDEFDLKDET
ncbi:hypothetical protein Tco_1505568 [Tanacetum coccineum]